jgi:hypothetical protein
LVHNNKKIVVDSRPSDAVALAIRTDADIYISEELMLYAGVDKEEFIKEHKEKLLLKLLELAETEEEKKTKH